MEDIFQSIKAFLYDRASSPLFGAFILSWIGWNYRIIMVILSSEDTYTVKFNYIDELVNNYIFSIPWTDFTLGFYASSGITLPLLTALAYIYIYPIAAEPVYKYTLKKQKSIRKLKKEANDSRIIDEKESRKLFKDLADIRSVYDTDITQYQKQVESLKTTIDELYNNNIHSDVSNSDQKTQEDLEESDSKDDETELTESAGIHNKNELKEIDIIVLKQFTALNENQAYSATSLSRNAKIKISEAYASLDRLEELHYIIKSYVNEKNEQTYKFTPEGSRYLGLNNYLD